MNTRRSWLVFSVGTFAYLAAVLQRTSLGVAGVSAAERFDTSATFLSSLAVVQLLFYALMQVPVGILIDRLGPRFLILMGTALMIVGQVTLAVAPGIGVALVGRILVGAGDAMLFISVIRLISSWFTGRIVPQLAQWTGNIGQLGQILSAVPFVWLLHSVGWTPAFLWAAALSVVAFVAVLASLTDNPAGIRPETVPGSWGLAIQQLKFSFARAGTQLGFWSHFVTQSPGTVFSLLWGFPFMVYGLGYEPTLAAALLTIPVFTGMVVGPALGLLSARYPTRRSNLILTVVFIIAAAWGLVLLWPGEPPFWAVVLLIISMGIGGPGSLIGFDYARTFNPLRSLGVATGIVNVGGFTASFVTMFMIGLILDLLNRVQGASDALSVLYSLPNFKVAFSVQYLVLAFGVFMVFRYRRKTRLLLSRDEGIEVAPIWVALGDRWFRPRKK